MKMLKKFPLITVAVASLLMSPLAVQAGDPPFKGEKVEKMERLQAKPHGGPRHERAHVRLTGKDIELGKRSPAYLKKKIRGILLRQGVRVPEHKLDRMVKKLFREIDRQGDKARRGEVVIHVICCDIEIIIIIRY